MQTQIKQFAQAAGYHVHQQVLHLHRQWVGRRDRWWCVLSARPLGPILFDDLPEATDYKVVSDVMQAPCEWPATEVAALELSLYEHHKIHCCSKGLESLLLVPGNPMPTALHSWGNHCYGCACGCRGAFSEKRLTERGVYAVLMALGPMIKHEGHVFPQCRHLHPTEVALLSGARLLNWEGAMRLGLAAAGQMASPLQAVWVCAHVVCQVSKFVQVPVRATPSECLASLKASVVHDCEKVWPRKPLQIMKGMPDAPVDHEPMVTGLVRGAESMQIEVGRLQDKVKVPVTVAGDAFVQSLVRAEAGFWDCPMDDLVCLDDQWQVLDDGCLLVPNMTVWIGVRQDIRGISGFDNPQESLVKQHVEVPIPLDFSGDEENQEYCVQPPRDLDLPVDFGASCEVGEVQQSEGRLGQIPQPIDQVLQSESYSVSGDALGKLKQQGLLEIVTPQVYTHSALCGLRSQMMSKMDRIQILHNQLDAWGDDEVRFHLHRIAVSACALQAVVVWDPLLMTSLLKCLQGPLIDSLIKDTPKVATVITAAIVDGHWIPLVWRKDHDHIHGFSFGVPSTFVLVVQNLHAWMCTQWKVPVTAFRIVDQQIPSFCGAVTISYVEHLIWSVPMVGVGQTVQESDKTYRAQFEQSMGEVTHRPWVWGKGFDNNDPVLVGLLRQHGVPVGEVAARADHVVSTLGRDVVQKAMASNRPWQELKWAANQKTPPYQLIRPSELQATIENRAKSEQPLGSKKQKQKGGGKGKGKSQMLEPDSLRLDPGIFTVGDGKPINQLSMSEIGPMAIGVVLCTLDQALPYISQNRQVSMGGLAVVVLNVKEAPSGLPLIAEPIRFPAVRAANAEPVLVQGLLFQLGNVPVRRATHQDPVAMECIQTFVAKLAVYRDGVQDWEGVTKQPVRYIQQHFQCLLPCREEECLGTCAKWHSGKEVFIEDPLMAVWNRQWLKGNFVPCSPDDATMFVVSIRVPVELEMSLIAKSGVGSIVVEPRELDGRQVSKAYHVVWLSQKTFAQAQVLKQTTEGALGLARIADKWGLHCRSEQASRVHKMLKPSTEYLPSGAKMHYLIGPVPYGTIKQSIVQACKAIEWDVRPLFATPAPRNVDGIMYKVQSVVSPPKQERGVIRPAQSLVPMFRW